MSTGRAGRRGDPRAPVGAREVAPPPTAAATDFLPLERYSLIGDSGTAALVSDEGSIDWLCLPRFDSDPLFARLLDPAGGHFSVRPAAPFRAVRRYVPDTAVLATTFTTAAGRATLYDFFAVRDAPAKRRGLWPFRYLVRRLEGEEGEVPMAVELAPRDSFGGGRVRLRASGRRAAAQLRGAAILTEASSAFSVEGGAAHATLLVRRGERAFVTLAYAGRDLGVWPPAGRLAEDVFHETVRYWRGWSRRARLPGPDPLAVRRSAITLKLLTFAPSGAVVAAPTTSLPEVIAGGRNWDYRFAWTRDASWTVVALLDLGYEEEARAYLFWATNAARLTEPRVHTLYTLYGGSRVRERTVPGLRGYLDSRPVRRGNDAIAQFQLDNWGHLVDAAFVYAMRGGKVDRELWRSIKCFVQFVAENWRRPDHGIWEVRGTRSHWVHSKVMSWVALDRGIRLSRRLRLGAPVEAWERERDAVKRAVLTYGVDPRRGSFTRSFGSQDVDASLLLIPLVGFVPPDDPRVRQTIDAVTAELGRDDHVYRYLGDDGMPGGEGAFVACSFWLAQALAVTGRREEAASVYEATCRRANDVGLLPEEIDPATGAFLGNYPQAFSHIALLRAAAAVS